MSTLIKTKTLHKILFKGMKEDNINRIAFLLMGREPYSPIYLKKAEATLDSYLKDPEAKWEEMNGGTILPKKINIPDFYYHLGKSIPGDQIVRFDRFRYFDEEFGKRRFIFKIYLKSGEYIMYHSEDAPKSIFKFLEEHCIRIISSKGSLSRSGTAQEKRKLLNEQFGMNFTRKDYLNSGWESYFIADVEHNTIGENIEDRSEDKVVVMYWRANKPDDLEWYNNSSHPKEKKYEIIDTCLKKNTRSCFLKIKKDVRS